jgi:type VI secretion system protein ImpH
LDWDLNLVLQQPEVPKLQLNGQFRLGFNTWLGCPAHDANDLILARHYADHASTSRNPEHG